MSSVFGTVWYKGVTFDVPGYSAGKAFGIVSGISDEGEWRLPEFSGES
ncbi:14390_t:CDS:2, partial [Acaulospora colombiana]